MKRIFTNPWPHQDHRFTDILKWKLKLGHQEEPALPDAPDRPAARRVVSREQIASPPASGWRVTWMGHASFLLQCGGANLLIDPVFSEHCFPLPLPGLRRRVALPCAFEDLPPIDVVLITHGHYDHLDLSTLRKLGNQTRIIVPEGHREWLRAKGFSNVREVTWHGCEAIDAGLRVTATPAQHFTARTPFDRNRGHWCGWLLESDGCKLWHAGDSGYCPAFAEIGARHGAIDFGMIPIGAYMPRSIMRPMHMNPAEAVQAFLDSRCRRAVAMHWGTFQLTDEALGEPPLLLEVALRDRGGGGGPFRDSRGGGVMADRRRGRGVGRSLFQIGLQVSGAGIPVGDGRPPCRWKS